MKCLALAACTLSLVLAGCESEVTKQTGGAGGATSSTSKSSTSTASSMTTATGTASAGTTTVSSTSSGVMCGDCQGFDCCPGAGGKGECVNMQNDIHNCGDCGVQCSGLAPYCDHGKCGTPACDPNTVCVGTATCCGAACCDTNQLCCSVPGPIGEQLGCVAPSETGTCPTGCVLCQCAAGDTMIGTADGDRPISEIRAGDLVYTYVGSGIALRPVLAAEKNHVEPGHRMVRLTLDDGRSVRMSGPHPTADGRTFDAVRPGDVLGTARVTAVSEEIYEGEYTYDLLVDSPTGIYFASGAPVGSTRHGPTRADAK